MRVGDQNRIDWWIEGSRWRRGVLRTQRERNGCGRNDLRSAVRKETGNASQRTLSEIVKDSKTRADDRLPIPYSGKLISNSDSGRKISIGRFVKRSATRREGHRR